MLFFSFEDKSRGSFCDASPITTLRCAFEVARARAGQCSAQRCLACKVHLQSTLSHLQNKSEPSKIRIGNYIPVLFKSDHFSTIDAFRIIWDELEPLYLVFLACTDTKKTWNIFYRSWYGCRSYTFLGLRNKPSNFWRTEEKLVLKMERMHCKEKYEVGSWSKRERFQQHLSHWIANRRLKVSPDLLEQSSWRYPKLTLF